MSRVITLCGSILLSGILMLGVNAGFAQAPKTGATADKPAAAPAPAATKAPDAAKSAPTEARVPPAKGMVWVNTKSGVFHSEGDRWYGKTKEGKFMTEADAVKAGYHAAKEGGSAKKEGSSATKK